MSVKLLTEHHFEFLSLTEGCSGLSESTHVNMPHCSKSHVAAELCSLPLFQVYELDGSTHDKDWVMQVYQNTTNLFTENNKDFTGARIIKSSIKYVALLLSFFYIPSSPNLA